MFGNLIAGALLGGLVFFIWSAISWSVLPWHHATFSSFTNEDAVARTLLDNVPESGIYGYPAPPTSEPGASAEAKKATEQKVWEQMKAGPLVFAVIQRGGFGSLPKMLTGAIVLAVFVALLLTWMLMQTSGLTYWHRVGFVAIAALAGAIMCRMSDWNWHGFPTPYTAVAVADLVIGWTLAGLLMARFGAVA